MIAGETQICWVDPNAGLMYRGYDIHEMAEKASFEEVAYLLLNGELPRCRAARASLPREIAAARTLPKQVLDVLRLMPKDTHPMDMLRTGVSMLGAVRSGAERPFARRQHSQGDSLDRKGFDPDHRWLSHRARRRSAAGADGSDAWREIFSTSCSGEVPQDWQIRMMDTIFILYADHEFNASTFAARVTASTLADIYAAVTSACGTLERPLHGGANEESMQMLDEIKTPDRAEGWLKDAAGEESEDHGIWPSRLQKGRFARADHARDRARSGQAHWQGKLDSDLREARANDGARKTSLRECRSLRRAGFTMLEFDPALNTPIFAASRVAGWCAHVVEQHDQ